MLEDTLVAWPTRGDGNCSFHALLGVWNGHAFFCEHLAERKKEAADAVRSIFPQHPLFEKVGAAIQQIIFEAINPDRKENFLDLRAVRTEYARRQAAAEQAAWLQLNIELIANQDIYRSPIELRI